jgi:hypothetical protein
MKKRFKFLEIPVLALTVSLALGDLFLTPNTKR